MADNPRQTPLHGPDDSTPRHDPRRDSPKTTARDTGRKGAPPLTDAGTAAPHGRAYDGRPIGRPPEPATAADEVPPGRRGPPQDPVTPAPVGPAPAMSETGTGPTAGPGVYTTDTTSEPARPAAHPADGTEKVGVYTAGEGATRRGGSAVRVGIIVAAVLLVLVILFALF